MNITGGVTNSGSTITFNGTDGVVASAAHVADYDAFPLTIVIKGLKFTTNSGTQLAIWTNYGPGTLKGILIAAVSGGVNFWLFRDGTTSNCIYDGALGGVNVAALNDGLAHDLIYVVDATNARVYVDGNTTPAATRNWTGTAGAPLSTTTVTQFGLYNGHYTPFTVDTFQFFPGYAFSTSEVTTWYNGGNPYEL
jgi:hypothetical protein